MGGFSPAAIFKPKPRPVAPAVQRAAVKAAPTGPTVAEMDQGKIRRGRGRRATILTSSQGVDEDLTLGYKTLLG
tara:strand:- start:306 stop:527 length:222 start_codon:yes stop_codon:yes gene_type:complete